MASPIGSSAGIYPVSWFISNWTGEGTVLVNLVQPAGLRWFGFEKHW